MSLLSDYSENKLIDMIRAQTWTLGSALWIGLASAAADGTLTELSGTGYARQGITRNLTNWAGTQGVGTTLASSGTTHASSNNVAINWGTSGSAWGTANYAIVHDAVTAGNVVAYIPLPAAMVIGSGAPVSIAAGALTFTLGLVGGCSDYLANKLIDFIWRGQAFTFPATMYQALMNTSASNAGGGAEVGGGLGYARVAITGSLANWAGTQAAGSTVASTGTTGKTSNNAAITYGTPSSSWGSVAGVAEYDASSGGNLLFWALMVDSLGTPSPKSVPSGATPPPGFPIAARTITFA